MLLTFAASQISRSKKGKCGLKAVSVSLCRLLLVSGLYLVGKMNKNGRNIQAINFL